MHFLSLHIIISLTTRSTNKGGGDGGGGTQSDWSESDIQHPPLRIPLIGKHSMLHIYFTALKSLTLVLLVKVGVDISYSSTTWR
jgi:hypothetical protein